MLIFEIINGLDVGFLEFKPSEIAAAVAIFVSRRAEIMEAETQAIDNAMSLIHVEKVIEPIKNGLNSVAVFLGSNVI